LQQSRGGIPGIATEAGPADFAALIAGVGHSDNPRGDPLAVEVASAIRAGDVERLTRLLRAGAECLLGRGADADWIGYDGLTALDAAHASDDHELADWLRERGAWSATELA
jgi:hypothetical protein